MSDIAILNFAGCSNYGANLTAYALLRFCEQLGHRAALVDRRLAYRRQGGYAGFYHFGEKHLKWTRPCYGIEHYKTLNAEYDTFMVGSDQVWTYQPSWTAPAPVQLRSVYDLEFAAPGKKRIAAAASFGGGDYSNVPPEFIAARKKALSRFSAISVREAGGVDICRDYFGASATHILDPVFLLSAREWGELADESRLKLPKEYVATCALHAPFAPIINRVSSRWAEEGDTPSIDLLGDNEVVDWVQIIRKASLVLTDSFHVTCFAIIFRKPFIYLNPATRGAERVPSLLEMLHLQAPLFSEAQILEDEDAAVNTLAKLRGTGVDFSSVEKTLHEQVAKAGDFFRQALASPSPEGAKDVAVSRGTLCREWFKHRADLCRTLKYAVPRAIYRTLLGLVDRRSRESAKNLRFMVTNVLHGLFGG